MGLVEDDTLEGTEWLIRRWLALDQQGRNAMISRSYPFFLANYSMKNGAQAIGEAFANGR